MNDVCCIGCKFSNNKLSKVEKGLNFTWCRKHRQHVSPNDICEYFKKEAKNETNNRYRSAKTRGIV